MAADADKIKDIEIKEKVVEKEIEDEMKQSYLNYSMSVIVGRALPDVRDGLKPVHRRILYAMYDMGMLHNKPFKKSARIVGEVLGKYHPHGDSAVYETMVRMVQDFSLRYPLIKGQGNFGSVDGDSAAAMRYTESKLRKEAEELLKDIEKKTVKFVPNFDESLEEPTVLPAKLPNLLINGTSGIAVGMATNMPPHNLREICDGIMSVIDNPEISIPEIMESVKGPDFPTGGRIVGSGGIKHAYMTGKGRVIVHARTEIIEEKGKQKILIHEIPYQVNKAQLIEDIAELVKDKKIIGINDIRDESDKDGMRVVIEIKKDNNPEIVLNQIYKHTRLKITFGIINLVLVDNQPKILNIKELMEQFILHRRDIVRKRTEFDLDKAEKRAHILDGLLIALKDIDKVIDLIKKSKNAEIASQQLIANYKLSKEQTTAILDMRLQRLTGLEQEKIKEEYDSLLKLIIELKKILADEKRILEIIKKELEEIKAAYGDERKTTLEEGGDDDDIEIEDMIEKEEMVISITHKGYIKRLPIDTYKQQRRGGRGVKAQTTKEEDFVKDIFVANTHDTILFFTDNGQVHWMKAYQIPQASRTAIGTAIVNLLNLKNGGKVTASLKIKEFSDNMFLVMGTKNGLVKKTELKAYSRPRQGGIRGITLEEGDELIGVKLTDGKQKIMLGTKNGLAIRFNETDVRAVGRTSKGVRGIKLKKDDKVIGMIQGKEGSTILTITERGYGKRTNIEEYRVINRAGVGVKNIITSERNKGVMAILEVQDSDDVIFISKNGIMIRTNVEGITTIGRNTQGVRLMKLDPGDEVVSAAKIIKEEEEDKELDKELKDDIEEEKDKEGKEEKGIHEKKKKEESPVLDEAEMLREIQRKAKEEEKNREKAEEVKDEVDMDDFDFIAKQANGNNNGSDEKEDKEEEKRKSAARDTFDSIKSLAEKLRGRR